MLIKLAKICCYLMDPLEKDPDIVVSRRSLGMMNDEVVDLLHKPRLNGIVVKQLRSYPYQFF
eukprot:UN14472